MTGESYATSAEMAKELGPFNAYPRNAESMLRVMRNHQRATHNAQTEEYEGLTNTTTRHPIRSMPRRLTQSRARILDRAIELGEQYGYRNAQSTVIAPTGTIGLVMDCDTTGIEPDFALVKFKKLGRRRPFKIINQSLPPALRQFGL